MLIKNKIKKHWYSVVFDCKTFSGIPGTKINISFFPINKKTQVYILNLTKITITYMWT